MVERWSWVLVIRPLLHHCSSTSSNCSTIPASWRRFFFLTISLLIAHFFYKFSQLSLGMCFNWDLQQAFDITGVPLKNSNSMWGSPWKQATPSLEPLGTNCCTAHVQIQGKSTQNAFIKFWIQLKSLWWKPFHLQYELAGCLITILLIRK